MKPKPLFESTVTLISLRPVSNPSKEKGKATVKCRIFPDHLILSNRMIPREQIIVEFGRDRIILQVDRRQLRFALRAARESKKKHLQTRLLFAVLYHWSAGDSIMLKKTLDALGLLHFIELANSLPGLVELFLLGFMGAALEQSGVGSLLANWVALGIVWLMIHLVRLSAESWVERQIEPILLSTPARLPLEP